MYAFSMYVFSCTRFPCTRFPCTRFPCTRFPCRRVPCTRFPCTRVRARVYVYTCACTRFPDNQHMWNISTLIWHSVLPWQHDESIEIANSIGVHARLAITLSGDLYRSLLPIHCKIDSKPSSKSKLKNTCMQYEIATSVADCSSSHSHFSLIVQSLFCRHKIYSRFQDKNVAKVWYLINQQNNSSIIK
jgi:hypothetical protein